MSKAVSPVQFSVFKILRENSKTGKTLFSKEELFDFAHKALKIASEIDGEDYWLLEDTDYNLGSSLLKICDDTTNFVEINEEKMSKGGKVWAERVIGMMRYSFLKGPLQVLKEEIKEDEKTTGMLCD